MSQPVKSAMYRSSSESFFSFLSAVFSVLSIVLPVSPVFEHYTAFASLCFSTHKLLFCCIVEVVACLHDKTDNVQMLLIRSVSIKLRKLSVLRLLIHCISHSSSQMCFVGLDEYIRGQLKILD